MSLCNGAYTWGTYIVGFVGGEADLLKEVRRVVCKVASTKDLAGKGHASDLRPTTLDPAEAVKI